MSMLDAVNEEHLASKEACHGGAFGVTAAVESNSVDPHGLCISAPAVFAMYKTATELFPGLLNRRLGEEAVIQRLGKLPPHSPFKYGYVVRQAFKFINPRGHGANSARFNHETLSWFRQTFPGDAHLTAGLSLIICAAKWWTLEQGQRSIQPRVNPLTTADLDEKLKAFGFLCGERQAILRLFRRRAHAVKW
ncbi:hypothetical protein ACFWZ1_09600 [Frateuria sp. GZRe14]|uniref:hypothetical protein n=1 Tax=Frateuria sp. GZRe14 TaxID=3351534 RepID=UPI003EDC77C2